MKYNLFRSNKILENDGLPFIGDLNLTNMKKAFLLQTY